MGDDEPVVTQEQAHVQLFPRDQWFTAIFNDEPRRTEIYCDVTTPVEFSEYIAKFTPSPFHLVTIRRGRPCQPFMSTEL